MTWQIDVADEFEHGIMASVIDSALMNLPDSPDDGDIDKAVCKAIDERCFNNWTMLEIVQHCGFTSDAFDLAYETFFAMVRDRVSDEVEED